MNLSFSSIPATAHALVTRELARKWVNRLLAAYAEHDHRIVAIKDYAEILIQVLEARCAELSTMRHETRSAPIRAAVAEGRRIERHESDCAEIVRYMLARKRVKGVYGDSEAWEVTVCKRTKRKIEEVFGTC